MTEEQSAARRADPEDRLSMGVWVEGQPMDVHGMGTPVVSRSGLRSRLKERAEAQNDGSIGSGEGVLVGLVDSGIVPHPWLNGGYLSAPDDFEKDFKSIAGESVRNQTPLALQIGHGTFAAGLILQQAPAAGVWVERVLDPQGNASANRVQDAAVALAHRGAQVINLSLGNFFDEDNAYAKDVIERIVESVFAIDDKIVIVAAAGNLSAEGEQRRDFWPAALPDHVVAVGAVDDRNAKKLAWWSNGGPWLDLAAPGTNLLSTYVDHKIYPPRAIKPIRYHGWARWSGTSFAAAVVSGAIAALATPNAWEPVNAKAAKARLATSEFCTRSTDEDPNGDVPSVPIVALRSWVKSASPGGHAQAM